MKLKRRNLLLAFTTGIIIGSIVFFTLSKEAILKASESKNMEKPNRLINEKSPYLLQHANNPVDWYPWGEEAFEKTSSCRVKGSFLSSRHGWQHFRHPVIIKYKDPEVANL